MNQLHNHKWSFLVLVLIAILLCLFCYKSYHGLPRGLSDKWQAVFLTNGQVYFGKLENNNAGFVTLKNVYYLKFAEELQSGRNLNLIRLGGEAHGPEGEMFIAKDKILFLENLKDDSTVVQAILNTRKEDV